MRLVTLSLILAAIAAPALAQTSAQSSSPPAQDKPAAVSQDEAAAAQAQAMAMRHKAEQDARIAAIACAAGDTSKCPAAPALQAANSRTEPRAPKD